MLKDRIVTIGSFLYRAWFRIRPPRDFVLVGIPRSGTSLLSALLSDSPNCFCFNEILYDLEYLPHFFGRMRRRIRAGRPVPAKRDEQGRLTTDTLGGPVRLEQQAVGPREEPLVLGSNVNVPYLDRIETLLGYRYRIVFVVRDPVFAIASWNSPKAAGIPEARVRGEGLDPRWQALDFPTEVPEERQALIWQHYAALIWSLREKAEIVRYEDLCADTAGVMERVCAYLGIRPPAELRPLEDLNDPVRFGDLTGIRAALEAYAPVRGSFGYGSAEGSREPS